MTQSVSHMSEWRCPWADRCFVSVSYVYEWGMSPMNEACATNGACPIWMRHVPYEGGISHMNESCPCEWVTSEASSGCLQEEERSSLYCLNLPFNQLWDGKPGTMNKFFYMKEHTYVWCDSFICLTWLCSMCDVTLSFSGLTVALCASYELDSLKLEVSFAEYSLFCRALLQKRPIILRSLLIIAFSGLTVALCVLQICDMTHPYGWRDSFICVTRLIHVCNMTHSYFRHDAFICATWLIHMFVN